MSKKRVIVIIIAVMIILGSIICFNFGRIVRYFQNKEWEIADSIASVSINNYMTSESTLENVIVIGNNYVQSYSKEGKEKLDLFISYQGVVSCSAGDYCVIGEKNGTNVCLIMGSQKQWENTINGSLYDVYVNKNGYVALIYKQSGYKSLIKVLSPDGNELFTSYFASTYAVDVAITNDNKMLAIAEVDTEGIHIVSSIKLIDMNHLGNENLQKIELEDNCLVVDIAYNDKNDLLIRTDASMEYIRNGVMNKLCDFNYGNTLYATIENHTNAILVTKEENGLFDVKYQLMIQSTDETTTDRKQYELYDIPKKVVAKGNIIAAVMDKEILIINTNAKLDKKVPVSSNVKDIEIFDNANMIGIIFRDHMELVKI